MTRVKKETIRSDTSPKKSKAKNKMDDPDYAAYQKWVKSKGFKELRQLMLERDGYRCRFCNRTLEEIADTKITLQAHHSSYENCGKGNEEELNDLICTCSVCHRACHSAKSNLSRFKSKAGVKENIEKYNPNMECKIKPKKPL